MQDTPEYLASHPPLPVSDIGTDAGLARLAELLPNWKRFLRAARRETTVLVADDDPLVRALIKDVLESTGYRILEAADGREALNFAELADLIITDLVMPDVEGIEAICTVRKQHPEKHIIAVSGAFGGYFLNVAKKLGADAIFAKPFDEAVLLDTVKKLLGPGRSPQEAGSGSPAPELLPA
jgi:CheY-like chemotaxis protein